jgi:hypothetical protein
VQVSGGEGGSRCRSCSAFSIAGMTLTSTPRPAFGSRSSSLWYANRMEYDAPIILITTFVFSVLAGYFLILPSSNPGF